MKSLLVIVLAALLGLSAGGARADLVDRKALSLADVKKIAAGAEEEAVKNKWNMVIVIVDEAGNLLYLLRMGDVQLGSIEIAIGKARTSARFRRPTKAFEDAIASGRTVLLTVPDIVAIEGGIPITHDGRVIGAVGVSGGSVAQDAQVAQAGVSALK